MRRRKIAVFGNSVSAVPVKEDPSVVPYSHLLQSRLKPLGWEALPCAVDGGTITQIASVAQRVIEAELPRIVILQTGIVDCALRPLWPAERAWLSELRPSFLRAAVIRLIHQFRDEIIRMRGVIQFTPLPQYIEEFKRIVQVCAQHQCRIGVLPIFPVARSIARRSSSLTSEIDRYNESMRMSDTRPHYFMADEFFGSRPMEEVLVAPESVHFNQMGHELIAERLFAWIRPLMGEEC